ncbi:Hypothetical predicted protein, partial [Paramuricea clavata]
WKSSTSTSHLKLMWLSKFLTSAKRNRNPTSLLILIILDYVDYDPAKEIKDHIILTFHGNSGNLLSYTTACQLNLLKVTINSTTHHIPSTNQYSPEFECLLSGIGKLTGKTVKLHIDPDVSPKQQPHCRIPFHVRSDVEKELKRLEELDIIEKVDGPTPWISPIVVVPKKSGEV